jgi:hypothetical protein
VIQELEKNILRFYGRTFTSVDIVTFSAVTNIKIIQSNPLRDDMTQCVFDIHDAQILQDAVDVEADFLVTNNMKDFDIQKIVDRYNLNIINRLPPIPSL